MADTKKEITKLYVLLKQEIRESEERTKALTEAKTAEISRQINAQAAFISAVMVKVGELVGVLQSMPFSSSEPAPPPEATAEELPSSAEPAEPAGAYDP